MKLFWTWKTFEQITALEMHDILSLRQSVFIVEQNSPYQDADELDKFAWHFIGRDPNDAIVGYGRIVFPREGHNYPSIGRLLVAAEYRRCGLGSSILRHCINKCNEEYSDKNVCIAAQSHLVDFYTRFGFEKISTPYDDAGVKHVDMLIQRKS
ncbi:MAG: GNAT family N-acetyltransferase [Cellvibrionaceae bacterium]